MLFRMGQILQQLYQMPLNICIVCGLTIIFLYIFITLIITLKSCTCSYNSRRPVCQILIFRQKTPLICGLVFEVDSVIKDIRNRFYEERSAKVANGGFYMLGYILIIITIIEILFRRSF